MFPNFCFRKNANDLGCHVTLYPKSSFNCGGTNNPLQRSGSLSQSNTRVYSMTEQDKRYCNNDIFTVLTVDGRKELQSPATNSVHRGQFIVGSQSEADRLSGGSSYSDQTPYSQQSMHKNQQHKKKQECPNASVLSSSAQHSIRSLQDSSGECFNIIFENVLKAVNGIVEQMVTNHFQSMLSRMNFLTAEITRQDHQLTQLKADLSRSK